MGVHFKSADLQPPFSHPSAAAALNMIPLDDDSLHQSSLELLKKRTCETMFELLLYNVQTNCSV